MSNVFGLLRWRGESGNYLVAHPFLDIISQGTTPENALSSFLEALAVSTLHNLSADGTARFKLAPFETSIRWAQAAVDYEASLSNTEPTKESNG